MMYDFAVAHEMVDANKRAMVKYLDPNKPGNPKAKMKIVFSSDEIQVLWDNVEADELVSSILILLYTGLRCNELLELKKEDVHLDERWFYIKHSKTKAGIREVPIADKIVPLIKYWLEKDSDYLICKPSGLKFPYDTYSYRFKALMKSRL